MKDCKIKTLQIDTPVCKSTVHCGEGAFEKLVPAMAKGQIFTVTDSNVYRIHRGIFTDVFQPRGKVYVLPAGEASKSPARLFDILKAMLGAGLMRNCTVFAVGGGVVGDIAGLAASLYMRGVNLVQVPTTLLSQVDSSVGGKTAVDLCGVKNIVGTFYQPREVVADPRFLRTLPAREIRCGLGEIIKYGALDAGIYGKLLSNEKRLKDPSFFNGIVYDCIACKADIVRRDEREGGLRKTLNLGHTTGHAFELFYKRRSHGEFVLIGMYYELYIAVKKGICAPGYAKSLLGLIKSVTSVPAPENVREACLAARHDKKNVRGGEISLVLPVSEGCVRVSELPQEEYEALVAECAGHGFGEVLQ